MNNYSPVAGLLLLSAFLLLLFVIPQERLTNKAAQVLCQPSGARRRFLSAGCQSWNNFMLNKPGGSVLQAAHNISGPIPTLHTKTQTPSTPTDTSSTPSSHTLSPPEPELVLTPIAHPPPRVKHHPVPGAPAPPTYEGLPIVKTQGIFFSLDGKRFTAVGTNWFDAHVIHKYSDKDILSTLKVHANKGVNVIRVFAHLNGGCVKWAQQHGKVCSPIQPVAGKYDEVALRRLDFLLDAAAAVNIRVILSMVNFWSDYHDGGMKWYVENARPAGDGQDMEYFFTDPSVKGLYKKYISTLVNRVNSINKRHYRLDGTVFAWELANEPHTSDNYELKKHLEPGSILLAWAAEMSAFIKHELQAAQMVCTGGEGYRSDKQQVDWYGWMDNGVKGMNFTGNIQLDTIDFATVHAYFMLWNFVPKGDIVNDRGGPYKLQLGYAHGIRRFLHDRADVAHSIGKPILLEEFGVTNSVSDWTRVYDYKPTRSQYFKCILTGAMEANYAGFLAWEVTPSISDSKYIFSYNSDGGDVLTQLFSQRWDEVMTGTDCTCVGTQLAASPTCGGCQCQDVPYLVSDNPSDQQNQPCGVLKAAGKCDAPHIIAGKYCTVSCGRCATDAVCPEEPAPLPSEATVPQSAEGSIASECSDEPPPGEFGCQQQAVEWRKCCEPWMLGKCDRSCKRCTGASKEEQMMLCGGP